MVVKSIKDDLSRIVKLIDRLEGDVSAKAINEWLNGNGRLQYIASEPISKPPRKGKEQVSFQKDLTSVAERLSTMESREAAKQFLIERKLLKNELLMLTSLLDIFVNKSDGKDKILEKIVESTVGARIRSRAIKETRIGSVRGGIE